MSNSSSPRYPGRAVIDLGAIRDNVRLLKRRAGDAQIMAVVKADAYGHGRAQAARAALAGGATWLGVAQLDEALALRSELEIPAPLLSWIVSRDAHLDEALGARIDLGVSTLDTLDLITDSARRTGIPARLHLKIDTGLGRAGSTAAQWVDLVSGALRSQDAGYAVIVGCWSHLACADQPNHPSVRAQKDAFDDAIERAQRLGAVFELCHLANSAGLLFHDDLRYDLVRTGISMYGLSPAPEIMTAAELELRPAMRLEANVLQVKEVPAGHGVSYGLTYATSQATRLLDIPLGYGDGIPRAASNRGPVLVGGRMLRVAGRVCMDQFVVDAGPDAQVAPGDTAVLFGSGADGEPLADDWARASDSINYEIVTRIGARVPRVYLD